VTSTFPYQHSENHIFFLSALGSLLLHGLLVAGLAYLPQSQIVDHEIPTVQVTLLPAPQVTPTPRTPTSPMKPRTTMQTTPPPPLPSTQPQLSQPPVPPLQASLKPPLAAKPSPMTLPSPAKLILKDSHASQAMKVRDMMKIRLPTQTRQTPPSLPPVSSRQHSANRVMPPISSVRKERSTAHLLPALPSLTKPRTLTATPPVQTGSSTTKLAIISSLRPIYPRIARDSGWEGTVIVRTLIDTNGVPSQTKIRKSCGHPTLDQAAQAAVKNWKFQPAKDGNIPIAQWVDIPIKFDLKS